MDFPLQGKKILVTREKSQAEDFTDKINYLGGISLEVPLIHFQLLTNNESLQTLMSLPQFDWIFFTSANGIKYFFEALEKYEITKSRLNKIRFAVVGEKTEVVLRDFGYKADFIPTTYTGKHMINEFLQRYQPTNVLVIQGNKSKPTIISGLESANIPYSPLTIYQTETNWQMEQELNKRLEEIDGLTFTSPSTIDAFFALINKGHIPDILNKACFCIGPTTKKRALEKEFKKVFMPEEHTIEGMTECLIQHFKQEGKGE